MNPILRPLLAGLLAASLPGQDPVPAPLSDQLPQLLDQSSWAQDTHYEGTHPDKSQRGVYPVGNGRAFAYLGLGARANTLQALTGPQYQTSEPLATKGHFGDVSFELLLDGQVVELPRQRVRRVRGANFAITEDAAPGGLALRTLTFAPPDQAVLVRVLEVINEGDQRVRTLALRMTTDEPVAGYGAAGSAGTGSSGWDGLRKDYAVDGRACTAFFTLENSKAVGSSLVLPLEDLGPGASQRAVFTVSTVSGNPLPGATPPRATGLDAALEMARSTWDWWRAKLAGTSRLETDHVKLRDLFEDWKVLMLVQRCARSGVISPMINHRGARLRDSNGAILALLRYHLWDEARSILRFFYAAFSRTGRITDGVDLDLDLGESGLGKVDWNGVSVAGNEVASWVILQHFWYWRATRDTELIRKHWPLLEVCMKKQRRGPRGQMTFDEDPGVLHRALYPQGETTYSFANGVLFLVAVQAMAEMTSVIDREVNPQKYARAPSPEPLGTALLRRSAGLMRDLEQLYWLEDERRFAPALEPVDLTPLRTPFANSNLLPLWVGWTFASGEKSPANLRQTLELLWHDGARIGTTPTVDYATGELQGMLLTALAERDGRGRLDTLDALLEMAEPAGEWGELYDSRGRPVAVNDPQWPNRLGPGESGINLDAIGFALTGVRFASYASWDIDDIRLELRLPHGATYLTMRNVEKDGRRLDIHMHEVYETLSEELWRSSAHRLPEDQRDPYRRHRRLHFAVDLLSPEPAKGYYDIAVNAMGTVFMRYLRRGEPVKESEFWAEDSLRFLPPAPPRQGK